jgi:hypothetical protein
MYYQTICVGAQTEPTRELLGPALISSTMRDWIVNGNDERN